ncbi:hypothetical protein SAMN05421688_0867 [Poseidonocella pacifica]|uniref:Phage tail protein (Tail_P2_I) n=1 Tax=Poseidonocella pacifica TaxID=871651 RepID=A0A1I0VR60_9RHOB|nr:hypothetical protein [Poseidonocella pacifica]SFA78517.1 hypothetical protein SAMN05421688_0867 [Poseidonocella pacifica]
MASPRQPLYDRLPEIYRIKDAEQFPAGQLAAFLGILDELPAGMRDNIEALYNDQFVETCADWVVPYIADLLGTSHLSGEPWTLRADVARTVFHRRRKGTLGAIESLVFTLSGWAAQAVELRDRMVWTQHLNHQRPDAGGIPPLTLRRSLGSAVRGGTVALRDPAALAFLGGPFDTFAHVADFRPGQIGVPRYNLPNLGIFLWRLEDYTVPVADPGLIAAQAVAGVGPGEAAAVVRCIVHPQADPMVLFNTHRYRMADTPPNLSHPDQVPGPMPWPRLTSAAEHGNPAAYVAVAPYAAGTLPDAPGAAANGLTLHVIDTVVPPEPAELPPAERWTFRGANLCAWEDGLSPPLAEYEIAIDPDRGRVLFGLSTLATEAQPLADGLFISHTYGFSGPTGAHPVPRPPVTPTASIDRTMGVNALEGALTNIHQATAPTIIEIQDSATYTLDLAAVAGTENVGGVLSLRLAQPLTLRAATGQRPVIRLERPLRLRPHDLTNVAAVDALTVTLEGLYITWDRSAADFAAISTPLVARAAVNRLRLDGTTLDPGGSWQLDETRLPSRPGLALTGDYDFAAADFDAFTQVPEIVLHRSVTGAVLAEESAYSLDVTDSIIDAGSGVGDAAPELAIGSLSDPADGYGPALRLSGLTCFGTARVASVTGAGGIWLHPLRAHDTQQGCLRFSALSGSDDRLPPHHGCIFGPGLDVSFTDDRFGLAGYAQLRQRSDPRLLEQGPGRDEMGAFGYLRTTHKWKNINIRFREYMPVGIRPIRIPVT